MLWHLSRIHVESVVWDLPGPLHAEVVTRGKIVIETRKKPWVVVDVFLFLSNLECIGFPGRIWAAYPLIMPRNLT